MNKTNWIKNDVEMVLDILQCKPLTKHNDVFFFNIGDNIGDDYLLGNLTDMVAESSGAFAVSLYRSKIQDLVGVLPSPTADYLLANSESDSELVFGIVMFEGLFKDKSRNALEFMLAHEIGHIVAGDTIPGNTHAIGSPEFFAAEEAADLFAKNLLGSAEGGKEIMRQFIDELSIPQNPNFMHLKDEVVAEAVAFLQRRFDKLG